MSIYGLCTPLKNFVCSWQHPVEYYISKLHDLGFNSLRVPIALQYIEEGDFSKLDHFVEQATIYNMSVLLDMHRMFYDHQDFSPFEHGVTKERFITGWLTVLERYYNSTNVKAMNVYNEYQGTDIAFLTNYSKEVLNYVEYYFPNRYVYYITGHMWSGSLENFTLEDLSFSDRVFYSVHKYWFSGTQDPDHFDYEHDWDLSMPKNLTKKIVVGEWGFKNNEKEIKWAVRFIKYLKKRGIRDTCFWTVSNSHDTGGLWHDDCETFDWEKFSILQTLWECDTKKRLRGF